jgi:hypothetical protein
MAKDLTHVIMEQAMKFGRTLTVKAADAIATGPGGGAAAQYVQIELRPSLGGPGKIMMLPTHWTDGRQMEDKDWIAAIQRAAQFLDTREST